MQKTLFLLIFIFSLTSILAQPAKPRQKTSKLKPPPMQRRPIIAPPPLAELCPKPAKLTDEEAIKLIVGFSWCSYSKRSEGISQKSFLWKLKINEDATLPPETAYQQYVEPNSFRTTTITYFTNHPAEVKKDSDVDENLRSSKLKIDHFSMNIEKNTLILTNEKSKEIEKFRVFLDEKKENILRIQNLKTEKVYEPSKPYSPLPMMVSSNNKN